jgi:hypothetical protein
MEQPVEQPVYEPVPGGDVPAPETPKKSNKTVWIIVIVAVVVLCCCCVAIGGGVYYAISQGLFSF